MGTVDVVWRLSSFVWPVKQAAIFRVPQQQLSQPAAAPSNGNVEGGVSFLKGEKHPTANSNTVRSLNIQTNLKVQLGQDPSAQVYVTWKYVLKSTFSTADTLAPLSKRSSTISKFLILVALMSGVSPS